MTGTSKLVLLLGLILLVSCARKDESAAGETKSLDNDEIIWMVKQVVSRDCDTYKGHLTEGFNAWMSCTCKTTGEVVNDTISCEGKTCEWKNKPCGDRPTQQSRNYGAEISELKTHIKQLESQLKNVSESKVADSTLNDWEF